MTTIRRTDTQADHRRPRDVETLLREFIAEALRLRAYADVVWATAHYEVQHSSDVVVELCATIAYVGLGDDDHALRHARSVATASVDADSVMEALHRIIGRRDIALRLDTPAALVRSIRHHFAEDSSATTAHPAKR